MMKIVNNIFFVFILSSGVVNAKQLTPLYSNLSTSKDQYTAFLNTESGYVSPTKLFLDAGPPSSLIQDLARKLTKAQKSFLQESSQIATKNFKSVISMAHKTSWKPTQRQSIHYAFLRLAQLSPSAKDRRSYLLQALNFDESLRPNNKLFPPPFLEQYQQLQKSQMKSTWTTTAAQSQFDYAIINGKAFKIHHGKLLSAPKGVVHVEWISNTWRSVSAAVDSSVLPKWEPDLLPWVKGDCKDSKLIKSNKANFAVLFPDDCLYSNQRQQLAKSELKRFLPERTSQPTLNKLVTRKKENSILKNKWFWAGLGAVALVVGYSQKGKKRTKRNTKASHR